MTDSDLALVAPEVRTLARPTSGPLLAARGVIQRNPAIRETFERARTEKMTPEQLAGLITPALEVELEADPSEIIPVAQYLADEFFQLGDAVLVIDRQTGRALARITEEDIWQPPDVPREGGTMATPLLRLRPDLQGFLVSHFFDQAKDARTIERVRERYPQTLALRDEGDPRLRAVTRTGRANMVDELRARLPTLLGTMRGASGGFLSHFRITDTAPTGGEFREIPPSRAVARSQQGIIDPLTFNLRHDRLMALGARIGTAWTREIAKRVAACAEPRNQFIRADDLCREVLEPADFWVVPPNAHTTFLPFCPDLLPVEGVEPSGLIGTVGHIVIGSEGYAVQGREYFGRWDVVATLDYTLYLDFSRLVGIHVTDISEEFLAEIV